MSRFAANNFENSKGDPTQEAEFGARVDGGAESVVELEQVTQGGLKRDFKERHVAMIAVAGALATGLVIGTGTGLVRGGPGSLLIAYTVVGATVFFVMTAVGEMATMFPSDRGFSGYATRFVDPALGFATGRNYFLKYAIVLPNNLTAAGIIIQYWRPDLNVGIFVAAFTVAIVLVNLLHVSFFGEAEFWMSAIKLLVMVVLILTCFVISVGGQPSGEVIGFRYFSDPGSFGTYLFEGSLGRFLGWWACMVQACFAYTGTEVVGIAFGEAPNPRKTIRKATRQTLWRIVFFYIIGALVLGMSVPYTNDRLIGVFGLARDGLAPSVFSRTTKAGVPIWGAALTTVFTALAYMNVSKNSSQVFEYLVSLVTVFGALNWVNVLVSYIRFVRAMKAQGIPRTIMPYRGLLQPHGSYVALAITGTIIFFNGYNAFIPSFDVSKFMISYIGIVVYLLNIVGYKMWRKTHRVNLGEMDLTSGRMEYDGSDYPGSLEKGCKHILDVIKRA